jgi:RNA polymerase sigma factor (TIGR02999 family)
MNHDHELAAITDQIHVLLARNGHGSDGALAQWVYAQLHQIAARALGRERAEHTLQATALVHEAYLELARRQSQFKDRRHFFAHAATCMRNILVDHARRRSAQKRSPESNSGVAQSALDTARPATVDAQDFDLQQFLDLDAALERLAVRWPRRAEVLRMHYFLGFKRDEVAELLEASVRTIDRELRLGEAWMAEALASS